MALTRIYKYRIREGAEEKYLKLQEEVLDLYRKHGEVDAIFLHDSKDSTFRTEVIRFFGSNPQNSIQKIDSDPQILDLFCRSCFMMTSVGHQSRETNFNLQNGFMMRLR